MPRSTAAAGAGQASSSHQLRRSVLTDHGSFVLLNLYVPNAGGSKKDTGRPRANAKKRFLWLLRQKVEELLAAGRQVMLSNPGPALAVCGTAPRDSCSCRGWR